MSGYLGKTVTALVCISLLTGFLPKEGAGKNVLFCARILAVILILSPIFNLRGVDIERILSFDTEKVEMLTCDFQQDAFCETLKTRIEGALGEKGLQATVTVFAKTDEAGNIVGVSGIEVTPFRIEIQKEIASLLEIDESLIQEGV